MTLLQTYQKRIAVFVMVIAISFGFFSTVQVQQVHAQTQSREALIELIQQLLARIAMSQDQTVQSQPETSIVVGDTVRTTDNLLVRTSPSGQRLTTAGRGAVGNIIAGPRSFNGREWWNVAYKNHANGWSAADWLEVVAKETDPVVSCPVYYRPQCADDEKLVVGETHANGCTSAPQCVATDTTDEDESPVLTFDDVKAIDVYLNGEKARYVITYKNGRRTERNSSSSDKLERVIWILNHIGKVDLSTLGDSKDRRAAVKDMMTIHDGVEHTETRDFWDLDDTFTYVVGVYEGAYPSGVRHSGGYHPQGEVTLTMDRQAGQSEDTMLVLTSYESVNWKLEGDAASYVSRVFLSGYYDQEIVGIDDDVEIIHQSYESGDSEYFYFNDRNSRDANTLIEFIKAKSGDGDVYPYYGAYSAEEISLGQKG